MSTMNDDQQNKVKDVLAEAIKNGATHKCNKHIECYFIALFFSIFIIIPLCLGDGDTIPWSNVCAFGIAVLLLIALIVAFVKRSKSTCDTDYYRFLSHVATTLRDIMQGEKDTSGCDEVKTTLRKLETAIEELKAQVEKSNPPVETNEATPQSAMISGIKLHIEIH